MKFFTLLKTKLSVLFVLAATVLGVFSFSNFLTYAQQSQPNLWEALGTDKTQVKPGEEYQYTVQIQNRDTQTFTNVYVMPFTFPAELEYIPGSSQAEKNGQTITLTDNWVNTATNIGALTPNQMAYVRYKVKVKDTVAAGTTITHASQVKADSVPWSAVQTTVTVVSPSTDTTLWGGEFLKAANVTKATGWQAETVSGEPGNIIEYQVSIQNNGQHPARNVKILAQLPGLDKKATVLRPFVTLSADNAPSVTDDVTVNSSTTNYLYALTGFSKKFGNTGLYDCTPNSSDPQGGCLIPDQFYSSPMNIGTVEPGEVKTIKILFKSYLFLTATPTPTPTPSPTPVVTPTPSPTPTATPVVTPTPSPTPTATPVVTPSPTPSPTPVVTPTPSPTPTPTPNTELKICKYEDDNGNGVIDNGEGKISWNFKYRVNNNPEQTATAHWWNMLTQGCVILSVPSNATISVGEEMKSGWRQTGLYVDGNKINDVIYMYQSHVDEVKVLWFLNTFTPTPTPTPVVTPSPTPSPTPVVTPSPTPVVTPTPSPTPLVCNATCTSNSDCQSGLVCHQDGSTKYCRHPDNLSSNTCDTRKTGGFFIRKYHDENGNGYQDSSEKGLSWKFQWDQNADNNWREYETFENKLGEGGVVTLPVGTQVRIREKSADGWTATTATEVTITIKANDNQLMVFGNWRGKPQVLGAKTPNILPSTGVQSLLGGIGSVAMYAFGLWMKKKGF